MTFPLALAVGIEGVDEVMELELAETLRARRSCCGVCRRRRRRGSTFRAVEVLPDGGQEGPGPERFATRRRFPPPCRAGLAERIERLLAAASLADRARRHGARRSTCARSLLELALARRRAADAAARRQPGQRRPARRAGRPGLGRPGAAGRPPAPHRRGGLRMTPLRSPAAPQPCLQPNACSSVLPNKKATT